MSGTLFDMPEAKDPFNGTKHPRRPLTAAPVGSGPSGATCGTCAHLARQISAGGKTFLKCGLMEKYWTCGPGSDIKAAWSACSSWECNSRRD